MKHFRAVAEKSLGIPAHDGRLVNPFKVRDLFGSGLRLRTAVRTWDDIPAASEAEARRLFAEAVESEPDMRGFRLVELKEVPAP